MPSYIGGKIYAQRDIMRLLYTPVGSKNCLALPDVTFRKKPMPQSDMSFSEKSNWLGNHQFFVSKWVMQRLHN